MADVVDRAGTRIGASTVREPSILARQSIAHVAAAIDTHDEGQDAAALGAAIADAAGADLMLVSIEPDLPLILPGVNWKRARHETEGLLDRTRSAFAQGAETAIDTDLSIPRGIERVIRNNRRDLVVVGSSRHGQAGTVSIARCTRLLLHELEAAVAIAPRGLSARRDWKLGHIAVGHDGTPEARAALIAAGSLAARCGARLTIYQAVDDRVPALGWPRVWMGDIMKDWIAIMDEEVARARERLTKEAEELGIEATVDVRRGRPGVTLHELSALVDLLVIGSHRWGPVARVFLGSTGEALAHGSHCPLLVVPRPVPAE